MATPIIIEKLNRIETAYVQVLTDRVAHSHLSVVCGLFKEAERSLKTGDLCIQVNSKSMVIH